jgi:hypothetical protein
MADVVEQGDGQGLSRRQLIKASAVAGAAAWTAPMIIDSLSSPAAALSGSINFDGASYAIIVFDKGGTRYVLKIGGPSPSTCANTAGFSGDVADNANIGTCHGSTFKIAGGDLATVSGTGITPYNLSNCPFLFNASGVTVTADPSITLIFGVAHAGSCSGNNTGGPSISKLSIVCASSNTITFGC